MGGAGGYCLSSICSFVGRVERQEHSDANGTGGCNV